MGDVLTYLIDGTSGLAPGGVDGKVAVKMAIDRKKQKLMRAIAEEEYETAAALRDEIRALTAQLLKYRNRQRRTLNGVGACAKLINEHEAAAVCNFKYINNISHMRREC